MTDQEFGELFEKYMQKKRNDMKEAFNRVLPSGEYIFNRFDKAKYLEFGEGSSVYDTSVIMGNVEIGRNVWIGPYTLLEGINGNLKIGDNSTIDSGVMIYTHDSTKKYVSGGINPVETGDVTIGHNTVIGTLSVIGCGISIGDHCVVGANSYVNCNVPDYTIVAGTPAKVIGKVIVKSDNSVDFQYY